MSRARGSQTRRESNAAFASPYEAPGRLALPPGLPAPCAITAQDGTALAEAIARRELSSREVVSAFLDRIDALNPTFNAIVSLRGWDDILRDADAADARLAAGERPGLLHGLPIAIKDLMPTRDLRTTFGSPLFRDFIPDEDGLAAARIRAAGAVIVGKTNTPEFGLGSHTFNPVFGVTGNAFDPALSAGGSSGGAAVAVATRMLPLADGSDMGGSLRNPAAWNNVLGLRPTAGRVPSLASDDLFTLPLATDGPMARTARDLARLLDVMAGPHPGVPLSLPTPSQPFCDLQPGEPGLRIGWLGDLGGHLAFEDGLLQSGEAALLRFEAIGHHVRPYHLDTDLEAVWRAFVVLRQHAIATRYRDLLAHPKAVEMKPEMRWEIEEGLNLELDDLRFANAERSRWRQRLDRAFAEVDLLVLPTTTVWPFPSDIRWPGQIGDRPMDSYHRWMEVVVGGTLAGLPVLALPAAVCNGLPAGVQVVGRAGSEANLLALMAAYEGA